MQGRDIFLFPVLLYYHKNGKISRMVKLRKEVYTTFLTGGVRMEEKNWLENMNRQLMAGRLQRLSEY
ncbi:MAG: hypothetical protein LKJ83_04215 [Eubacteriaceae bacterium]|jgi:hypothetical protein|nr:hypothetical protein [Eubacteriaceae bacterium]